MQRVFKKITSYICLILLLANFAVALESEYKNSLTKVELIKTSEDTYNVNLYTSKKYSEPLKIIKKSDLNYYIILPETKDTTTNTSINTNDIRNVSTNLYPYSGADVKNGYTKININTNKPINFKVSTKNASAKTAQNATVAINDKVIEPKKEEIKQSETKVQKKNSVFQSSQKIENSKTADKIVNLKPKTQSKKPDVLKQVKNEPKKFVKPTLKPVKNVVKTEKVIKKTSQKLVEKPIVKKENKAIEQPKPKEPEVVNEEPKPVEQEPLQEELNSDENSSDTAIENEQNVSEEKLEEIERIAEVKPSEKMILLKIKNKLKTLLLNTKLKLCYSIASFVLAMLALFGLMRILNYKNNNQPKLKSRAELMEKLNKADGLIPKKAKKTKNNGQYFVFDNDIKQTGFCNPIASNQTRNYELSSYEPELRQNGIANKIENDTESEYDIIQKILKEDDIIEVSQNDYEMVTNKAEVVEKPAQKAKVVNVQPVQEPVVMSSVEIAAERGFMCVSYNDNINLMGYIFDDVFPLYNFKQPKLENYEIRFRLTDKDDKSASFIVRAGNEKMLIRVTKNSMKLEVAM